MRFLNLYSTSVSHLFLLVLAWESGVKGQPCPSGQITHIDAGQVRCCVPAECAPNHYLKYCIQNGTEDTCEQCPHNYGLYKRTSSFAYEPCHLLLIDPFGTNKCTPRDPSDRAALEDKKNCLCNLEKGLYYYEPEINLGILSTCQPIEKYCDHGYQPNQKGKCEPCPPNTVQDAEREFRLCRPQRNCTALRLETKIPGNSTTEAVCATPPPLPATVSPVVPSTLSSPRVVTTTTTTPSDASVRTSVGGSESDAPLIVVVAVVCSVLVICVVLILFLGIRKGWFRCIWKGKCHHEDLERRAGPGGQIQLSSRDNDNTSDNSCYTCADSCLTSPNKNSSSAAGKAGASKPSMLEAYMNMNGKCPQSLSSNGSLSEPLYNSISQDDNLPSYKNTNGFVPSALKPDLLGYPNRVQLTSCESDSFGGPEYAQVQQRTGKNGKEREDFGETDPLLRNTESPSSAVPTPNSTPVLRGILRNPNNRRDPKGSGGGTPAAGAGAGEEGAGNRPHLSMLLNSTEDTSHLVTEDSQAANLPHLSQLVSAQASVRVAGPQPTPPPQRQQLLQQQAPPQQEQQGPEPRAQRLQQRSPLAAHLIPVSSATQQPQLNPSLVQMEELKPVLPLSPGPSPVPTSPTWGTGAGPRNGEHSGSPARISPTQQEVRLHRSPNTVVQGPVLNEGDPIAPTTTTTTTSPAASNVKKDVNGKALTRQDKTTAETKSGMKEKEINEETFRKQAMAGASPGGEETLQKSVCASSGLGDSLEFSSPLELPSEEEGRSRTMYRRSNSEASRSVSPVHQLPPSRSNSTPEEKHRPFAVVKPMQSDQSLNAMSGSHDHLAELTQQLDAAGRHFPLTSLAGRAPGRQSSQPASDDGEQTRPKTPDNLSVEEEGEEGVLDGQRGDSEERTQARFFGENDNDGGEEGGRRGKGSDRSPDN